MNRTKKEEDKQMSISKFNKTNSFIFKAPEGFRYYSLKELVKANGQDMIYPVLALYINNKGRYGAQPLAVTDKFFVKKKLRGKLLYVIFKNSHKN